MSLTTRDLEAIKKIVVDKVDELAQATAAGFADVYEKLDELGLGLTEVKETTERIERVQRAELERNDKQDKLISHMRKKLHAV